MPDGIAQVTELTIDVLKKLHEQDGAEAAVEAAKEMIYVAASVIAREHGPDEARRTLEIAGLAQGRSVS